MSRRILVPAVLASLLAGLLSTAGPLAPAVADVTNGDVPRVAGVADTYPLFVGGKRTFLDVDSVTIPSDNCVYPEIVAQPGSGVEAAYTPESDTIPSDADVPYVGAYELAGPRRVKAVLKAARRFATDCAGRNTFMGETQRVTRFTGLPQIADGTAGYRIFHSYSGISEHQAVIFTRVGRRLVQTTVINSDQPPSGPRAVRLARLQARLAR